MLAEVQSEFHEEVGISLKHEGQIVIGWNKQRRNNRDDNVS